MTNIIFSFLLCLTLIRLNQDHTHSNWALMFYSFGLGPIVTVLVLYYLLLFFPHNSNLFYFLAIIFFYLAILFYGRNSISIVKKEAVLMAKDLKNKIKNLSLLKKMEYFIIALLLVLLTVVFLIPYLSNNLPTPLEGTDALKYGSLGKNLFEEKSLEYRWSRVYPETGFYLLMNHAPSFSLLLTWEKIFDSLFKTEKDLYYKSTSAYFALLIVGLFLFWLSKKSIYLALIGIFTLFSGFLFFQTLIIQHLDSFRIFFLIVSWIFLAYALEKKDRLSLILFGLFSGFAAFTHTIGAIFVLFNFLTFFVFWKGQLKARITKTALVAVLIIFFGWFHYILDIFWGFGWVIFDRNVTWWG